MFVSRHHGAAHFLALASATTAVVGLRFDDLKWAISIVVSMFGSAVALYIFRGKMRAHAELLARVDAELTRRRVHPDRDSVDE
jgi:NO-binding membrane sensor protein with MHYT domain